MATSSGVHIINWNKKILQKISTLQSEKAVIPNSFIYYSSGSGPVAKQTGKFALNNISKLKSCIAIFISLAPEASIHSKI